MAKTRPLQFLHPHHGPSMFAPKQNSRWNFPKQQRDEPLEKLVYLIETTLYKSTVVVL